MGMVILRVVWMFLKLVRGKEKISKGEGSN